MYPLRADSTIELTLPGPGGSVHTGHFLLDTGANVSALDPDWAQLIAVSASSGKHPEEAVLPALRLGGLTLERPRFRVEPLASSSWPPTRLPQMRSFIWLRERWVELSRAW